MTEVTVAPEAPQGKGKLIVWGVGVLLLVAAGVVVYVLMSKKTAPASSPTDSQGKLADWKRRDGYVGSVDPVECTKDSAGQPCQKNGAAGTCQLLKTSRSPGIASGASPGPTTSYDCVAAVPGGPGWAKNGQDCAAACYASGDYWALFNSGKNTCVCRPNPDKLSFWDRCVPKNVDDRGWEVWSSPEHQQDCDSSVNAIQGLMKGVGALGLKDTVQTRTMQGCQVEVKERLKSDPQTFAVFDNDTHNCYVKSDLENPFDDCVFREVPAPASPHSLITDKSPDDVIGLPNCIPVNVVKVKGDLSKNSFLRPRKLTDATDASDCVRKCGNVTLTDGYLGSQTPYAQPAAMWEDATCMCYDFPSTAASNWRCAWGTGDHSLYVRNDTKSNMFAANIPDELKTCEHDPSLPFLHTESDTSDVCPEGTNKVCDRIWVPEDGPHHRCVLPDIPEFSPLWGNAGSCTSKDTDQAPNICVDHEIIKLDLFHQNIQRCTTPNKINGSPCRVIAGSTQDCASNYCYQINVNEFGYCIDPPQVGESTSLDTIDLVHT